MASKLYKIVKVQIGETQGAGGKPVKQMLEIGRLIEHEARGNKWCTFQLTAAHLGPVLYQLCKPYMRKGSADVDGALYDPPMRKSMPASEEQPAADAADADDWADPDAA